MNDHGWSQLPALDDVLAHAARKPALDAPYESPLEEAFAQNVVKYLDDAITLRKQLEVNTVCGQFRIDFVAERSGRRIGLECDGAEFHPSPLRDEWRDAMILGDGSIACIYRFRGKDVFTRVEDCLFILSAWEARFFSERGLRRLEAEASEEAKSQVSRRQLDDAACVIAVYRRYGFQDGTVVERHSKDPFIRQSRILVEHYAFAKKHGGGDLDQMIRLANPRLRRGGTPYCRFLNLDELQQPFCISLLCSPIAPLPERHLLSRHWVRGEGAAVLSTAHLGESSMPWGRIASRLRGFSPT
jgi:very-short-patch-repair endonuclease